MPNIYVILVIAVHTQFFGVNEGSVIVVVVVNLMDADCILELVFP